jgi:hypothetical protein
MVSVVVACGYDYVDCKVPMLARMFERRRVGYRAMRYREGGNEAFLD